MDVARKFHSCPFKDFNTTVKHVLRMLRGRMPAMEQQFTFMLAGYKMMKTINKRWPQRYYHEAIHVPYGARVAARDEAFFVAPGSFRVEGYDELVGDLLGAWRALGAGDKDVVWEALEVLHAKCGACAAARAAASAQ